MVRLAFIPLAEGLMVQKRLAAILSADIVGFSRLMGEDEQGTFEALRAHRAATDPEILERGGRIVGTSGDSVLAEFVSVLDAVEAALEIQHASARFNREQGGANPFVYRIGIDLGDVIVADDGDIFGDGVNIAARLQSIASPGGVCVSETVYRSVHRRTAIGFRSLGDKSVKNISSPIPAWEIVFDEKTQSVAAEKVRNPFRGLRPFREQDARDFYGRQSLVEELVSHLRSQRRFLALVGPSGSGKSSVVRAGLLPALENGAIDGSEDWLIARMVPGSQPFAELEASLLSAAGNPTNVRLDDLLVDGEHPILRAALRVLPNEETELLLFVDQFEEVFALVEDEKTRSRFLDGLVGATGVSGRRVHVLVAMRADFYDGPLHYPVFGELFTQNIATVMPLGPEELEAAVVEPARRVGVEVEPGFVNEIVTDVRGQPGALPLFQYTLSELFESQQGLPLTLEAYRELGGIRKALTKKADELFHGLSSDEQRAAEQMFMRLVAIGDDGEESRRRLFVSELNSLTVSTMAMQAAMDVFGRHRLITFDRDAATGEPTVEVAHEALIREWDRLREWLDEHRNDIRLHGSFSAAVREWLNADEDDDFLLTGPRFERYSKWSDRLTLELTEIEKRFLQQSQEFREAEARVELERRQQEESLRRQARVRLVAASLSILALVVVLALVLANLGPDHPPLNVVYAGRDEPAIGAIVAAGIDRAERELGVEVTEIVAVTSLQEEFASAASTGGLVVAVGQFDALEMISVVPGFPDATFAAVDLSEPPDGLTELTRFAYEEHEGAFLAGAAAASESRSGVIGFIGGIPTDAIEGFRAGYEAGARQVRSDIVVLSTYLTESDADPRVAFASPGLGRITAERLYRQGADVIFHAAGGSGLGILEAAEAMTPELGAHLWYIGVDGDEYLQWQRRPDLQRHILTSVIKRFDLGLLMLLEQFVDDRLEPGVVELGLAEKGMDLSTSGGFLTTTEGVLTDLRNQIVDGEIQVPRVPTGQLLPLLAAPVADEPVVEDSPLRGYIAALGANDWNAALETLESDSIPGPFGNHIMDLFDFDTAFEPTILETTCEIEGEQVSCTVDVVDLFTTAIGAESASRTYSAIVSEGAIAGFVSIVSSDDEELENLFDWVLENFPEEAAPQCGSGPNGACGEYLVAKLAEWSAQR